jgi:predicted nucleic acid-binding protein
VIVYADTSFLLAERIEQDANHKAALKLVEEFDQDDWIWCELHDVEVFSTARTLTRRQDQPLPRHTARAVVFRLERELRRGYFQKKELPLKDSTERAKALSESYGFLRRHTALDVWHVAAAWCFGANRFVTFDERQSELAEDAGLVLA